MREIDGLGDREIFLGVDGGQSHTEALIADRSGNILGRGLGGASNHAEQPGGRERLSNAVRSSVGAALVSAGLAPVDELLFASAHLGMTGGADYKEVIIAEIICARQLSVGHDGPTALAGAASGQSGIIVIAGTGSVIYGENAAGKTAKIGGLGFLFSDEGSGFWLSAQTIRLAIKEKDGLLPDTGLEKIVLDFFGHPTIRDLTNDFYNDRITRDRLAGLAAAAQAAAADGNAVLRQQLEYGAAVLADSVRVAAERLSFDGEFMVATVGGMFRGQFLRESFASALAERAPKARLTKPRFGPAIGALLTAFKNADVHLDEQLMNNLENTSTL